MITNNDFLNNDTYIDIDENKFLNNEINVLKEDEVKYIIKCRDKIKDILGEDFELSLIYDIKEYNNIKILNFKFVNKSKVINSEKFKYINDKIELLKKNNFIEIEDLKISGQGRFIKINIKTIYDYEKEKIILLEEFTNKIKLIDEKIYILMSRK